MKSIVTTAGHSYLIIFAVPPKPPAIRVHRVTSDSITLRWSNTDIGNSPIISYRIKYKITYGDWTEKLVRENENIQDYESMKFKIAPLLQLHSL